MIGMDFLRRIDRHCDDGVLDHERIACQAARAPRPRARSSLIAASLRFVLNGNALELDDALSEQPCSGRYTGGRLRYGINPDTVVALIEGGIVFGLGNPAQGLDHDRGRACRRAAGIPRLSALGNRGDARG
jgi:hypothetical protein